MASTKEVKPTTSAIYRRVEEVVAKLGDREFCAPYVVQVNKGSEARPRFLDVIEWHTAIRMLDAVFGPFGYDLRIINSTSDYANGLYTVDMELTARAITEDGTVVSLTRPGRGLGLVPRSAITSDAEHDRQAHGAKSDAITNATKGLGDGFGLYLYQKRPAQSQQSQTRGTYPALTMVDGQPVRGGQQSYANSGDGSNGANLGPRPSEKQMGVLAREGYPAEFVATLQFSEWKGIIDAIFAHREPEIPAPTAAASQSPATAGAPATRGRGRSAGAGAPAATMTRDEEPDDIPF